MKKKIVRALMIVAISGFFVSCKSTDTLPKLKESTIENQKEIKEETKAEEETVIPQETSENTSIDKGVLSNTELEGTWYATGRNDQVDSIWEFANGTLLVNKKYYNNYIIANQVDKNGYTFLTIYPEKGEEHGLLLKKTELGMEGITVEEGEYKEYKETQDLPATYQLIDYRKREVFGVDWENKDMAIDFYENMYKNPDNNLEIAWENYKRDLWTEVESNSPKNIIVLHFTNIGGAGGSYTKFERFEQVTELTEYDGNATYPNQPSYTYTVRNSDYKVIDIKKY